jgi:hypothetical protein
MFMEAKKMELELAQFSNVQSGLKELLDKAYSMSDNFKARVDTPILPDGTNLWTTWLDSKTMQLYGGVNEDSRQRFKIDHSFGLTELVNASISSDGSIATDEKTYSQSQGTEFVVIPKSELKGAKADYAIRSDKYQSIREQLNKGNFKVEELEKAGAFKINVQLTAEEAKTHDGWLELAVGKNKASNDEYAQASTLLNRYVPNSKGNNCFPDGTGMGFFVETGVKNYKARSWIVCSSDGGSSACLRFSFGGGGRFLRVRSK